jgi:hypothetical protein
MTAAASTPTTTAGAGPSLAHADGRRPSESALCAHRRTTALVRASLRGPAGGYPVISGKAPRR